MDPRLLLSALLAVGIPMSAGAADPNSALLKQCESATGEVKRECEAVAKDILTKDDPGADERNDKTDQDVTHSSPAMASPSEAKPKQPKPEAKPAPEPKPKPE